MLAQFPKTDKEILRLGIIAELDAVSLYEQLAKITKNKKLRLKLNLKKL